MKLLIDTSILLWMLADSERLTEESGELIDTHQTFVSSISLAEIEIPDVYREMILHSGIDELLYPFSDSGPLNELPFHHKDPFDRMLISQAIVQNMMIITSDAVFSKYKVKVILN